MHPGANAKNPTNLVPVSVPGAAPIMAVQQDGKEWASVTHICKSLGIDPKSQRRKLHAKSWATEVMMTLVADDGKEREMHLVDRRTLTMWLATIDAGRVAPEHREALEAYQAEAADALDKYFHSGGAINPRADEHQINALLRQAQMQMELCQAARGLIHEDHLEAKARIVLARGLGETPELEPATRPLYAQDYLAEKGLSDRQRKAKAGVFGKRLKKAYIDRHGREPEKYPLNLSNGQVRHVNGYTEADRPLMDEVWSTYFGEVLA
ncbi:phage antirepressor N-terminal domain-containing protein [Corynebacterium provencense]|uniref:phage antirepressor N-terminal domain-containing protein n=1 Tax=Corynebacterium provencense TaxID=1737425 RepID=UPI00098F2173|nr:phage antirepressor N-terminal domain-containing protein [Corynebacterium provencense]